MKRLLFLLAAALLFINGCQKNNTQLLETITKLEQRIEVLEKRLTAPPPQQQPPAQAEQTQPFDLPVGASHVWGPANAPLTLVKFSDYQCPFCHRAHETFVEKLMEDKELAGKFNVVFKQFPLSFHQRARPAAKAALAAGEQGHDCFWKMTKLLYVGQRELTDENFKKWAGQVECTLKNGSKGKLNATKFWSDYTSKDAEYEKVIKEDMDLGMNKAGVRGTPSFFLNGWKLGQRSVEAVKQLIKDKNLLGGGDKGVEAGT